VIAHNSAPNSILGFPGEGLRSPRSRSLGGLIDEIDRSREMGATRASQAAPQQAGERLANLAGTAAERLARSTRPLSAVDRAHPRAGLRVGSGYWFLRRRVARPGPTSGLEAEGSGPG
jgi:hypothetical protein